MSPVARNGSGSCASPLGNRAVQDVRKRGKEMIEVKRLVDDCGAYASPIAMSGTHQDDWCRVSTRDEARSEADAVEPRHFDVANYDVERPSLDFIPGVLAVVGTTHDVPRFRKEFAENVAQMTVVIDDED